MLEDEDLQMTFVDDILVVRYLTKKPITLEIAKTLVERRKEITKYQECRVAIVMPNLSNITKEARDYLSSEDATELLEASAMVTGSILGRVIVNFFLKLNARRNNGVPNQVFNNEEDAIMWLKNLR